MAVKGPSAPSRNASSISICPPCALRYQPMARRSFRTTDPFLEPFSRSTLFSMRRPHRDRRAAKLRACKRAGLERLCAAVGTAYGKDSTFVHSSPLRARMQEIHDRFYFSF
jgi:hypothetical protein